MACSKEVAVLSNCTAEDTFSRRSALGGGLALGSILLVGCSRADERSTSAKDASGTQVPPATQRAGMVVYRDPSCGCCKSWADIARGAGYNVTLRDDADMAAVKKRLGVPDELASCHTATIENLVVEGHVPMVDVARLLASPGNIRGIAVPGMPAGSPGMEMPDGTKQPFQVMAFDAGGKLTVYSTY